MKQYYTIMELSGMAWCEAILRIRCEIKRTLGVNVADDFAIQKLSANLGIVFNVNGEIVNKEGVEI